MTQIDASKLELHKKVSGDGWSYNGLGVIEINSGAQVEFTGGEVRYGVNNYGVIMDGFFGSSNVLNYGTIAGGTFKSYIINNGTIKGGAFSSSINNNAIIEGGAFSGSINNNDSIKGGAFSGSINNDGTIENLTPKAGLSITGENANKITISENMQLSKELYYRSNIIEVPKNVLLTVGDYVVKHGSAVLNKFIGEGIIYVNGYGTYHTNGQYIGQHERLLINDSFRLTKATQNAKEQKYLLDEKNEGNAQNDLQNDFKVDLLAVTGQNDSNIII